jgi:hypothetical protein
MWGLLFRSSDEQVAERYSILQKNPNGDFFQTATYQYYGELCLAFSPNWGGGGKEESERWEETKRNN